MNQLRLIGLCSLFGLATTTAIGYAVNTGTSLLLQARRAGTKSSARRAALDCERLLKCIEAKESGGREQIIGDGGKSWGLYQFGLARRVEGGGARATWGRAARAEQTRVMRNAIQRYLRSCPPGATVEQQIVRSARMHNGWGKGRKTVAMSKAYAADILRRYRSK